MSTVIVQGGPVRGGTSFSASTVFALLAHFASSCASRKARYVQHLVRLVVGRPPPHQLMTPNYSGNS